MRMQPNLLSNSSSNGSPRGRAFDGDIDCWEWVSSDLLNNIKRCKIGRLVSVRLKDGSGLNGVLHGTDDEKKAIILKVASTLRDATERKHSKIEIIPADEIVEIEDNEHLCVRGEDDPRGQEPDNVFVHDWDRFKVNESMSRMSSAFLAVHSRDDQWHSLVSWEEEQQPRRNTNVNDNCPMEISTHSYGPDLFTMNGLPEPLLGEVLGLAGGTGYGKTTALQIMAGFLKPNLGQFESPEWQEVLDHFSFWSKIPNFLTQVHNKTLNVAVKVQNLEDVRSSNEGVQVSWLLEADILIANDHHQVRKIYEQLDLNDAFLNKHVSELSDGELQRVAIAKTVLEKVDVYIFDEPFSFLDSRQKLKAAQLIRSVRGPKRLIFLSFLRMCLFVEHDVCLLDYMVDQVCGFGGSLSGLYGEVQCPSSFKDFLWSYLPGNHFHDRREDGQLEQSSYKYKETTNSGDFDFTLMEGTFTKAQVLVVIGDVSGKFLDMLVKTLGGEFEVSSKLNVLDGHEGTVKDLLDAICDLELVTNVVTALQLEQLYGKSICNLSRGEKQRVAITICLGKPADIYLIDDPSAHLDYEQRIKASVAIKSFILQAKKTAFIVEHDLMMVTYMADRVIVVEGDPAVKCTAHTPQSLPSGMNLFLSHLDITVRRDRSTLAPRINKSGSVEDIEQKAAGEYFRDWIAVEVEEI